MNGNHIYLVSVNYCNKIENLNQVPSNVIWLQIFREIENKKNKQYFSEWLANAKWMIANDLFTLPNHRGCSLVRTLNNKYNQEEKRTKHEIHF